jgi:MFS family permease
VGHKLNDESCSEALQISRLSISYQYATSIPPSCPFFTTNMSEAYPYPDPEALAKEEKLSQDLSPPSPSSSSTPPPSVLSLRASAASFKPSLPREILLVATVALANFTAQASLGNTIAILPILTRHFNLPASHAPWLIAGYSLTLGTFILPSGRLGDVFGHKRLLILGFIWFALWSLIAGLSVYSHDGGVLFIFARVMQGIGPAITLPNSLAVLGVCYWGKGRRKDMVFAIFGGVAPGGAVCGAAFAGLFSLAWWPWTYFALAIALLVIAVVAMYAIPDFEHKSDVAQQGLREILVSLDLPGAVLGIAALVLINFAWNQAPIAGWAEAYVIVSLILGFLLAGAFFIVEIKFASKPLIPFHALSGDVPFVLGCIACGWGAFGKLPSSAAPSYGDAQLTDS